MERRNATLEDVARAAGVSRSTVSRVVNRQDQVAPEVRQSVQRMIDRLGYHPHAAARALASGRAGALDLVIIDDHVSNVGTDPYYARVVAGLAGVPIRVHLVGTRSAPAVLDEVASSAGLGALLVNVPADLGGRFYRECRRVVSLGRSAPGVPYIDPENVAGAYAAIHHLYGAGRRRIAAVHGPRANPCANGRRTGYADAIRDAGLMPISADGDFRREGGLRATRELLAAQPGVDAIFAGCDHTATGVLQALAQSGRRVPDDVAVIGFDDSVLAACANPPLTTVCQPVEQIAATAATALLNGQAGTEWHRIVPTELVIRESA